MPAQPGQAATDDAQRLACAGGTLKNANPILVPVVVFSMGR